MCNGVSVKRWKSFMSHYCYKIGIWKNLKRTLLANKKYNLIFQLLKSYEQRFSSCIVFKITHLCWKNFPACRNSTKNNINGGFPTRRLDSKTPPDRLQLVAHRTKVKVGITIRTLQRWAASEAETYPISYIPYPI